jgi:hypothetical protein
LELGHVSSLDVSDADHSRNQNSAYRWDDRAA